jgi:hypothetical protein
MIRSVLLLAIGAMFLLWAVRSLRAMRLKERYALLLMFTGLPFIVLSIWPQGIELASMWLQIEHPTVITLALGLFLLIVVFKLMSIISVQDRRISALAQHVAILMEKQNLIDGRFPGLTDAPGEREPAQARAPAAGAGQETQTPRA